LANEAVGRKQILFLTPQLPFPPQQGTAIRNLNLIRQVAKRHRVHLLSFAHHPAESVDRGPLDDLCETVWTVPVPQRNGWQRLRTVLGSPLPDMHHRLRSAAMSRRLETLAAAVAPDVVQIEGLEMAQYGLRLQTLAGKPFRLGYDAHNAEHILQKRIFESDLRRPPRWPAALYSWIQWQKLLRYEARICRTAWQVVACSTTDARCLGRLVSGLRAIVVPNGVDTQEHRPGVVPPARLGPAPLVFTGKMDFRPNVDAVLWFANRVLPALRETVPEAHFYVVGKSPHPRLVPLEKAPGITITGFVEDVRPYVAAAAVYVVPLLTGGGTRLKVLEAMAMGRAIVSTSLGCEGISAVDGRDVVLANRPAEFAQQICGLLQDASRRQQLGRSARAFVVQHFQWQTVTAPLTEAYERGP
jgi:sugar transferase (PEP-CTERM/EpsH1 system associated)